MDADFLELMADMVTIEPLTGQDAYGKPTYGAAATYPAHISGTRTFLRRGANGQEVVSAQQVVLGAAVTVTKQDRITMPAGHAPTHPPIVSVEPVSDERGAYATVLNLGV